MRKGEISRKLYFILFQLVLVVTVAVAMFSFSSGVAENRGFLLTYIAKDTALTATTVLASPSTTTYESPFLPGTQDVLIDLIGQETKAYKAQAPDVAYRYHFLCTQDECPAQAAVPLNDLRISSSSIEEGRPTYVVSSCPSPTIMYAGTGDAIIIKAAKSDKNIFGGLRGKENVSIGFFDTQQTKIYLYAADERAGCDALKEVFA